MEKERTNETGDSQVVTIFYEPPEIEVIEVSIEKGFANSAEDWNPDSW